MRKYLTTTALLLTLSVAVFAQDDFISLDKQSYDCYMRGDYKNLKKVGNELLAKGIDYYYLRMRLGILAYNNQRYPSAVRHFKRALDLSLMDTISREYIYFSYLFSGRDADANLYLESIPWDKRNSTLQSIAKPGLVDLFAGGSITAYNGTSYIPSIVSNQYYEDVKDGLGFSAGLASYFSSHLKADFVYSRYQKSGTVYSSQSPAGRNLDFVQNQVYAKLTEYLFPGWAISGFGHLALYSDGRSVSQQGNGRSSKQTKTEYIGGVGLSKSGWKVRVGANVSFSNFSGSSQTRGEGYLTYLPFGNLNLYLTSGGMYQTDKHWGNSYQVNQEVGFKVFKFLWMELGVVGGDAFLYARNQGLAMNNSFQVPATTAYSNLIVLLGKHVSVNLSPYYSENNLYLWNFDTYSKTNRQAVNAFGCSFKLTYKIR